MRQTEDERRTPHLSETSIWQCDRFSGPTQISYLPTLASTQFIPTNCDGFNTARSQHQSYLGIDHEPERVRDVAFICHDLLGEQIVELQLASFEQTYRALAASNPLFAGQPIFDLRNSLWLRTSYLDEGHRLLTAIAPKRFAVHNNTVKNCGTIGDDGCLFFVRNLTHTRTLQELLDIRVRTLRVSLRAVRSLVRNPLGAAT